MKPLSTSDLQQVFKNNKDFLGVFALNKLPRQVNPVGKCKLIVNLQYANLPGTHWTAISRNDDGVGDYFDSFGRIPPLEIQAWLIRHCTPQWTWNEKTVQKDTDTVSCGYLCIDYLNNVD